jgi:hypothetical protein
VAGPGGSPAATGLRRIGRDSRKIADNRVNPLRSGSKAVGLAVLRR